MNFRCLYLAWDYYLESFRCRRMHDDTGGFGGGHALMSIAVVSYPDVLVVGNAKVDANDWTSTSPL